MVILQSYEKNDDRKKLFGTKNDQSLKERKRFREIFTDQFGVFSLPSGCKLSIPTLDIDGTCKYFGKNLKIPKKWIKRLKCLGIQIS